MKLIIEKHPEQNKLSQYFKKIESIAEKKGINVDQLIDEPVLNEFKSDNENVFSIYKKRKENFSKEDF